MTIFYYENEKCIINKPVHEGEILIGVGRSYDSDDNIISHELLNKNPDLAHLLEYTPLNNRQLNHDNTDHINNNNIITMNDNDSYSGYVEHFQEDIACPFYSNLNEELIYIAYSIPILFLITGLMLMIVYCKYRNVLNNYQQLREESDTSGSVSVSGSSNKYYINLN